MAICKSKIEKKKEKKRIRYNTGSVSSFFLGTYSNGKDSSHFGIIQSGNKGGQTLWKIVETCSKMETKHV